MNHPLVLFCLPALMLSLAAAGPAYSAVDPTAVKAEVSADNVPLETVTADLQRRYGLNFIIDGVPGRATASPHVTGTLRVVLDRIGDTYGYEWRATAGGVVLLTKSFRNPDDAPQAHLREILRVADDIAQLMRPWNLDTTPGAKDALYAQVVETLDRPLIEALKGGEVVPFTALTPAQQQMARRGVMLETLAPTARGWANLAAALRSLQGATLTAKPMKIGGYHIELELPSVNRTSRKVYLANITPAGTDAAPAAGKPQGGGQ